MIPRRHDHREFRKRAVTTPGVGGLVFKSDTRSASVSLGLSRRARNTSSSPAPIRWGKRARCALRANAIFSPSVIFGSRWSRRLSAKRLTAGGVRGAWVNCINGPQGRITIRSTTRDSGIPSTVQTRAQIRCELNRPGVCATISAISAVQYGFLKISVACPSRMVSR